MASTGDSELRSHGFQVLHKHWEITGRDDELEVQKQWIHAMCSPSTSGMKDSEMGENQRRTIRGMVHPALWKCLWRTSLFDTFSKNVNQTWCLQATEVKFYGDDSGHNVSI